MEAGNGFLFLFIFCTDCQLASANVLAHLWLHLKMGTKWNRLL